MPSKDSAGILAYKKDKGRLKVFLVHPGGPFWKNKDLGAWSIPKGEYEGDEPLEVAIREMKEETGFEPSGNFIALSSIRQKSGKRVMAWAVEAEIDAGNIKSNLFEMEWPPRSGKKVSFPEVDRAEWFDMDAAKVKILPAQVPLLLELQILIGKSQ